MQRSERCAAAVFWRRAVLRRARQGVAPDAMRGIWARTCVLAERRGNAAAICAGRICAQASYRAVCGGYAICGGLHSDRPAHRLKLHGNPRHVTALAERSGNAAAICAGRICAQAGYRGACGGYAICGWVALRQAGAPAQAARQSAARNGVGRAEWPTRRAICSGRIDAQAVIAPYVAVTRSAAHLYSDRPSHRLQLHGNPQHVTALAWRSGRRGTRYAQAESTLRRVIAPHVAVTRSAARRHAVSPSHRAQPRGG